MKTERSILSLEAEADANAFKEPMFSVPFREALELLFEVNLPLVMDGINFMNRTYTDSEGVVYRVGDVSADDALTFEELEQRIDERTAMLIRYTANVSAWSMHFGINIGFASSQLQPPKDIIRLS